MRVLKRINHRRVLPTTSQTIQNKTIHKERTVLLWTNDLRLLGFRQKADRYWRCDKGYGLGSSAHISLFLWTTHLQLAHDLACYEIAEFHITFEVPRHNLHFYYHEVRSNEWTAAGHTSTLEIASLGLSADQLRQDADEIAQLLVGAFGGTMHDRIDDHRQHRD